MILTILPVDFKNDWVLSNISIFLKPQKRYNYKKCYEHLPDVLFETFTSNFKYLDHLQYKLYVIT